MSLQNRGYPLVSGIVVVVPQHMVFLAQLLQSLQKDKLLRRIVIVASGFAGLSKLKLKRMLKIAAASREIVVIHTPLQSAGANRNVGLGECQSGLVLFMDADDIYSPYRTKIGLHLFQEHRFDLMLHGFVPFLHGEEPSRFPEPPPNLAKIEVVREGSMLQATLLRATRNRGLELLGGTETTNLLFDNAAEAFEVQHAHAIVRREALGSIRFHEEFGIRNEDGVFARDMLEAGKRILLTPFVLSAYRHGARAKPKKLSSIFKVKT